MRSLQTLLLLLLIACTLLSPLAMAQTSRGTATGIVSDPQSAVVPRAEVELTNRETGVKRTTTTNEAGLYRFDAVDLGAYDLSVKAAGFQTFVKRGLAVQGGQILSQDVALLVGETRSIVEVDAQAQPILQYESAIRGDNISSNQITQLPLSSRDPVQLGLLLPGVTTNRFAWGNATFVVNGSRGRSNNFLIDGTENNDVSVAGQAVQIVNTDAVAEVSMQTSNYDAEFGRAGGAVVNTITKSGTNEFHGTVSYLLDATIDDAITNTQSLSDEVRQRGHPLTGTDQWFGGTVGGPIRREKTFFFGSFQQERQKSQSQTNLTIPTAVGRQTLDSLFPRGTNPRVDLYNQVLGSSVANSQPFNVVMGDGRSPVEFGTAIVPYPQKFTESQMIAKVDHQFSENDLSSVRYILDRQSAPKGYGNADFPGFFTSYGFKAHNIALTETHVFSPRVTNEIRLAFNRSELAYPNDPENPIGKTMPRYTIGGGITAIGVGTTFPQGRLINNYSVQDAVSYVRGTHSFRFGLNINQQRARQFAPIRERGEIGYGTTTGYSNFANFVEDFGGSSGGVQRDFGSPAYYPSYTRHGYFAQDRWRVTRDLTLTLGVRYEYFGLPMNTLKKAAYSGIFNLDPVTFDGPYREFTKVEADKNNWSPTLGLAYSPSGSSGLFGKLLGDKKTVIRTGYQIGYDSFFNNIASNAAVATPNVLATLVNSLATDGPRGMANWSTRLPVVARDPSALDSQTLMPKNLVNPYYQRWSFGIQRELPASLQLDVSYVGSKGTRLFVNEDLNPVVPANMRILPSTSTAIPSSRKSTRFDALQGSRLIRTNGGSSTYHALQLSVNRRLTNGLGFTTSYTFSKLIDNASEVFGQANTNSPQNTMLPSIFGGLSLDRGLSLFDRTNRAAFTCLYELPFMKGQKGPLGHVLGGWETSAVTTFETGVPLNVYNGQDADGIGGNYDRPLFNPSGQPGVRATPNSAGTVYTNPDTGAVIDPATAMYIGVPANTTANALPSGNLGRNTLRVPGLNNFNVNFLKRVRITERWKAEFRTEFYNIWNHTQYGTGSVSPFSPGGGSISANVYTSPAGRFLQPQYMDGGGRVIKYQLKILF